MMLALVGLPSIAQTDASWLENTMYNSGKINVVVTVVAIVFVVIVVYLIRIDKRLKAMEQKEENIQS